MFINKRVNSRYISANWANFVPALDSVTSVLGASKHIFPLTSVFALAGGLQRTVNKVAARWGSTLVGNYIYLLTKKLQQTYGAGPNIGACVWGTNLTGSLTLT